MMYSSWNFNEIDYICW